MDTLDEYKYEYSPAFPTDYDAEDGMSLRDYFAAKAMQGLIACGLDAPAPTVAESAYRLADAMLKARQQ